MKQVLDAEIGKLAEILSDLGDRFRDPKTAEDRIREYKLRFRSSGLEGLKDLEPIRKARPRVTSKEVTDLIVGLSLEHPGWGCIRLGRALKERGVAISPPTVQSILNKNNLRDKHERAMQLEEKLVGKQQLTTEQMEVIEAGNPCFRERVRESKRPGELLVQDTFFIGNYKGNGKLYLQIVIDTYNNYAFCLIHAGKVSDYAVALLHNEVIPFYETRGLGIGTILTDNGREYCGKGQHHFELYLKLNDITHERLPLRQAQTNGFIQRFRNTVLHEFFLKKSHEHPDELAVLRRELTSWLDEYNRQRKLRGYRNFGKSPEQMLHEYLKYQRMD